MSSKPERLICVTGFGLFDTHVKVNASWEAVRLLPSTITLPDGQTCRIIVREIPVTYEAVDQAVDDIWTEEPDLVIHCGVHPSTQVILLEKQSLNGKYCRPDQSGKHLECDVVPLQSVLMGANQCPRRVALCTGLDVDAIVKRLSASIPDIQCMSSHEVGNFLCGYSYLKSLDRNADRTLFIHVPIVDQPYSSSDTCRAILRTIELCLEQIYPQGSK